MDKRMRARKPRDLERDLAQAAAAIVHDPATRKGRWLELAAAEAGVHFRELRLDLGCGKGRFTVQAALAEPDVFFVGLDVEELCVARAAAKALEEGVRNAVFAVADGDILGDIFAAGELARLYINFPTPHPRAKHAWKRLTHAQRLSAYRMLLAPGGCIELRTDHLPFWLYSLEEFRVAGYDLLWRTDDLHSGGMREPFSDYELKLSAKGAVVYALRAVPGQVPASLEQEDVPQSLIAYLPDDLEGMERIPYGMEDTLTNMRNRRANARAREAARTAPAGYNDPSCRQSSQGGPMDPNKRPDDMLRINTPELAQTFIDEQIVAIQQQVGDGKVLLALSGGVDSSVVAALLIKAIGKQLVCVHVNHGLMRKGESEQVIKVFRDELGANLIYVDAVDRFLDLLAGVDDPEAKRHIIGEEFIKVFAEEAAKLDGIAFLGQGTIYPDILESVAGVKAHHNVGGLPEDLHFELVEPVKLLFKDEVRVVGKQLGLPDGMVYRQPFPGPGLGVRCTGAITRDRLEALREADAIVREEIDAAGVDVWQYFAVVPDYRATGVRDGKRAFEWPCIIRCINTVDVMTATVPELDWALLKRMTARILAEVPGICRVCYELSPKPIATVEW
ncbi:MAG: glutamine-hydrolyzing GMP synthase, partial [Coriobacteriales bacterium]|nr:glutamine-hydrolyzing GMP synthase [Coriobacteriales bacterium]